MLAHGITAHVDLQAASTPIAKTFYMRTHSVLALREEEKGGLARNQHNLGFRVGFRHLHVGTFASHTRHLVRPMGFTMQQLSHVQVWQLPAVSPVVSTAAHTMRSPSADSNVERQWPSDDSR